MKRYLVMMTLLLFASFVVAEGSEISAEFNVGGIADVGQDYIPSVSFWDAYGAYVIGSVILLIVVIVFLKNKKKAPKRRVKKRKVKKVKRKKR